MSDAPIITERENGPLIAKNVTSMTNHKGETIETKPVMALCRCGASQSKPFCDGSHNTIDFDTTRKDISERDKVYTYSDDDVTVHFSKLLCSHAGACVSGSIDMFNPKRRPWVILDAKKEDLIADIVAACPSGALRLSKGRDDAMHLDSEGPQIRVEHNGAYWVKDVELDDPKEMQGATPDKLVLCRCGLSSNKPYCDGTHFEEKWRENS
jgi:CDGSH-type Zn-finger protein